MINFKRSMMLLVLLSVVISCSAEDKEIVKTPRKVIDKAQAVELEMQQAAEAQRKAIEAQTN